MTKELTLRELRGLARAEVESDDDYIRKTIHIGELAPENVGGVDLLFWLLVERHRANIFESQVADIHRAMSKAPRMNPRARKPPSKTEEVSAFGHALLNLVALAEARGVDIEEGVAMAVSAWKDHEFQVKRAAQKGVVKGNVVSVLVGPIDAQVAHLSDLRYFGGPFRAKVVLVADHLDSEETDLLHPTLAGVILDYGGMTTHAAIVCRERGIPCIVSTGNAVALLKRGETVTMHADGSVTR